MLQGGTTEHFEPVAGRVGEGDHLVDAAIGQFCGGALLVGHTLYIECVPDLLQGSRIRALPAGSGQPVVLAGNDHQPRWEIIHPQV